MTSIPTKIRALLGAIVLFASIMGHAADESARRSYDIPAGDALAALKQFAAQAGVQLLYSTEELGGVRTTAVRGDFTAEEALRTMLDQTGLVAARDAGTGAFAVRPASDPKKKWRKPARGAQRR